MGLQEEEYLEDIIEWDIRHWSKSLNYWRHKTSVSLENSNGLEIGSRNGGLSLWLAAHGCKVICSDVEGPTERARELHQKHGVSDRIEYNAINATQIPYEDDCFDIVVFKSVLGGIGANDNQPAQVKALKEMYRVLKPGGELFFAENLTASPMHRLLRKRFVSWGNAWRYVSIQEMKELLEDFSKTEYFSTGFFSNLGRNEKQRNLLAAIDDLLINHLVPEQWKYILIGVAKK